ncbi:MAG TPA: DUF348 domain-containing protein [Firmicutes bacterium]|jgi:uncharacterized protein YabE (DUF348 family)|nr:DUF348 domain-containing protein [Bacillota bacterium]
MEENEIEPLLHGSGAKKRKRRRNFEIGVFLLLALALFAFFYCHQHKEILVIDGTEKKQYSTFSGTVEEFLLEKGLGLQEYDKVVPARSEQLADGDIIVIKRATPVFLTVAGRGRKVWTHAQEAAGLLREQNVELKEDDQIFPALNHPLKAGDTVAVVRIVKEYKVSRVKLPYRTIRIPNPDLESGAVHVRQEGREGLREEIWELTKEDGREISRVLVSSTVDEPQDLILEQGEKNVLSRAGRNIHYERVIIAEATAYCPGTPGSGCPIDERGAAVCTGFYNDGYTFTGVRARAGDGTRETPHIIAVDPQVIPLKSLVYLEGYGYARAEDTGGAIKGAKIDLLFDKHREALAFGRKKLRVYILK